MKRTHKEHDMTYNFDEVIERRASGSFKWNEYPEDVLPMFVADMDFRTPQPIIDALEKRVEHGLFGYQWTGADLQELVCKRMARLYNWRVEPRHVIFLPGVVCGLNLVCRAVGTTGDAAITLTPIYPPFLTAPTNQGMSLQTVQLKPSNQGPTIRYEIDLEAFRAQITKSTKLFTLCHPHNPTGREFTQEELRQLGEICIEKDLFICSDEIHCDLTLDKTKHTPLATVSPEIADRCVTLMAPSKTFNLSGLGASYAIVQNNELRRRIRKAASGIVADINVLGLVALKAAYGSCDNWVPELLRYLLKNRDTFVDYVVRNLPSVKTTVPEATYLAWLDCRQAGIISRDPYNFFLQESRVAVNDGASFGPGGEGFVRFNFGCPQAQMMRALEQMRHALEQLSQYSMTNTEKR